MTTPASIRDHYRISGDIPGENYLLLCDRAPVTVRSQQIRALNLLYALHENGSVKGHRIAVIGGGAAGLMFAAGAAVLGARVEVFEKDSELHLQFGCWHRPLHPEIFTWPGNTAYRVVSHLPLLGWATGRAHDVADEILAKFAGVPERIERSGNGGLLEVRRGQAAALAEDGRILVSGKRREFEIVVLAVGFGVEDVPYDLPWNSYWRADQLDQSFLGDKTGVPHVVVVGAGDGGLIEVARSCLSSFDQGALLDRVLNVTLDDAALRDKVKEIEVRSEDPADGSTYDEYLKLDCPGAAAILKENLRPCRVTWLIKDGPPFKTRALAINRFIVSQIVRLSGTTREGFSLTGPICGVDVRDVLRHDRQYVVECIVNGKPEPFECDHAIIRYGPERVPKESAAAGLLRSISRAIVDGERKNAILNAINEHLKARAHRDCHEQAWPDDFYLKPPFEREKPGTYNPTLHADFIEAFRAADAGRTVYRMRIRLEDAPEHLRVTYDLHPETGRVVSRIGGGDKHEQWLNTYGDYTIRARTNDGREWFLGTVVEALQRGSKREAVKSADGKEATFEAAINDLVRNRAKASPENERWLCGVHTQAAHQRNSDR